MPELRPDPDHDAVCASVARHQVVVAPPGTGKTCLSIRLAGELAPGLASPSAKILVVTFSNQARTQLEREAAFQLSPAVRRRIEITNYHRFFWKAVLAHRRALGLPMRLDVGSRSRRERALEAGGHQVVETLKQHEGLIDSLAEHAFPEFRDERIPPANLAGLLEVVRREHRAGLLVFDDLGALFWELLQRFPVLNEAYRRRFPVTIADEHQDASALQDAVVRRLGQDRLIILADPMQLIHGFRGARPERLERHLRECQQVHALSIPHRWHGNDELAEWLLAVRARLAGEHREGQPPAALDVKRTRAEHGLNPIKTMVRIAIMEGFRAGCNSVAVLARTNDEVNALRRYLAQQGLYPRQIGGDFEEARVDIERLPLLQGPQSVALHALDRISALVPTLDTQLIERVRRRLTPEGVNQSRRVSAEAARILGPLERIYAEGPARYIEVLVEALDACAHCGHNLPRFESVRALRDTAGLIAGERIPVEEMLGRYSEQVMLASHAAPRLGRGLFVMTAHQAKGKEFDAVVLADVSSRFWPDDEESRRLFYVAITRATARWVIVAPDRDESPLLRHLPC